MTGELEQPDRILSFKQLDVYQLSFKLAVEIHKFSLTLPKIEQYALADQLRRTSRSICANLAEGHGKKLNSVPEFRRFLAMAFGSSEEMSVWLDFCKELNYFDAQQHKQYSGEYVRVSKMLRSIISKWK
jgi:four helix bundle protein